MGFFDKILNYRNKDNTETKQLQNPGNNKPLLFKSLDATFIMAIDGLFISVNKKFTNLLGYKLKKIKTIKDILIDDSFEKMQYHVHQAKNKIPSSFAAILVHKKGHHIPVHITLIPSVQKDETVFIYGLCRDLTTLQTYESKINKLDDNLERVQKIANIGSWEYDLLEDKVIMSKQTYRMLGIENSKFILRRKDYRKFIHPKDIDRYELTLNKALERKKGFNIEYRIIRNNGEERTVLQRTDIMRNEQGNITCLIGTVQDITDKKELAESKKRIQSIANQLPIGIWSLNPKKKQLIFCSKGMENIYGVPGDMLKEDPLLHDFTHPEDLPYVLENHKKLWEGEELFLQYRIIDKNGQVKWLLDHSIPFFDDDGNLNRINGIVRDITEEKNHAETLAFLADHDQLTGLPNRRCFSKQLQVLMKESKKSDQQFALFYLDLDRFKHINKTLGHEVGDKLLRAFSLRLKNTLGRNACIARIGGDEFAIYIRGLDKIDHYLQIATKINHEIGKPFYLDDYELYMTTSIGISFFPFDGEDSPTLLKSAGSALYKAKEAGRNDWKVYSSSMNIGSFKLYQLERDMRKACMNNEFYIEYQAKVQPKTGEIVGAEALIRWEHPEWGIVSPTEFILLAEENGCIFKMGDWVLKEVCQLQRSWKKAGLPVVPISVNVSPKRLLKADFVHSIQEAIEQAEIDPGLIELELTEHVIIKNIETTKKVICKLKNFGVKFALDDFGTGYSSLSYIKELDIETLKIDKSFIDGIGLNEVNEGIIKSVIFLAKELGIHVVAEGVERKEQLNFLLQYECPQIQGYIYSRPVKETEFKKLLTKGMMKPVQTKRTETATENRRKYFRLKFDFPLCADMTIVKFKNKDIKLGKSRALIKDISLGGIGYLSDISLPVRDDLVLQFTTTILDKQIQFVGKNVWKLEVDGLWRYGFELMMSESEREQFAPLFNQLVLQLKRNPLLPGCHFLQESKTKYFKQ